VLKEFAGEHKSRFLCLHPEWKNRSSTRFRRHLHPALKQLGFSIPFTGNSKLTIRRSGDFETGIFGIVRVAPKVLESSGLDTRMSHLYDEIKEDVEFRREWAEKCGFGFKLPSVVPNVPKTEEKYEAQKVS
jgi:hypothetical protein